MSRRGTQDTPGAIHTGVDATSYSVDIERIQLRLFSTPGIVQHETDSVQVAFNRETAKPLAVRREVAGRTDVRPARLPGEAGLAIASGRRRHHRAGAAQRIGRSRRPRGDVRVAGSQRKFSGAGDLALARWGLRPMFPWLNRVCNTNDEPRNNRCASIARLVDAYLSCCPRVMDMTDTMPRLWHECCIPH